MKKHHFDIMYPYEVVTKGALKATTTIIFCDYVQTCTVIQSGNEYPAKLGYCGRDKKNTKARYLFIDNKIYHLDDLALDIITESKNGFIEWLYF